MKNTRRKIFFISFIGALATFAIVLLSLFIVNLNKPNYAKKLEYDLTKKMETSVLAFNLNPDNKTAEFAGFSDPGSVVDFADTLEIPSEVYSGEVRYTVTRIARIEPNTAHSNVTDQITALIVPDTVEYIAPAAFETFASLRYISIPFVGTERGVAEASGSAVGEDERPLGAMFSSAYTKANVDNANTMKYESSGVTYVRTCSQWYKGKNSANTDYYLLPQYLKDVVVTDDTAFPDRAFFQLRTVETIDISSFKGNQLSALSLFAACEKLVEVNLPSEGIATIGLWFFSQSPNLKQVKLPYGLTEIPEGTFYHCYSLEDVIIPQTIQTIGKGAFRQCRSLADFMLYNKNTDEADILAQQGFRLPKGIISIAEEAFAGCAQIKEVNLISDNLVSIGSGAFKGCYQLQSISLPFVGMEKGNSGTKEALFGYIFGSIGTTSYDDKDSDMVSIPGSYQYCDEAMTNGGYYSIPVSLKNITINGETIISRGSLMNLTNVESIYIGDTVTTIEEGALAGTSGLIDITVPFVGNNVNGNRFATIFGKTAQDKMYSVGGYHIPNSLVSITITNQPTIKSGSFSNITSLENLTISNTTTYMEEAIFYNNRSLETLKVPFVGNHRDEFFAHYWWWRDKAWRNTLQWLFSSTTSGGEEYANKSLEYYGGYIKYIPTSLRTIEITDESYIGTYSFRNFKYVTDIRITNTPNGIARGGFYGCESLQKVTLPFVGSDINTQGLSGDNYTLGWLFGIDQYANSYAATQYGSTYYIPKSLTDVSVHGSSTTISNQSFANMTYLEDISFAAPIASLGHSAFRNCKNLDNIKYPNAVFTVVGDYAFAGCSKISALYETTVNDTPYAKNSIPASVKEIGAHAYEGTSISYIDFNRFSKIGAYAFKSCLSLTEVNIPAITNISVLKSIGEGVFSDCGYLTDVTLGNAVVSKYMFKNCLLLENINLTGVTTIIPEGMFYGCKSLKYDASSNSDSNWNGVGINIDDSTTLIQPYAFYGCSSLKGFEITTSLTTIQTRAFNNCVAFDSLIIPDTVTTIEANVWNGCNEEVFCFYVFAPESEWSSGWVDNWNCDFPVYLLGQADESIYEFAYIPEYMAYELVRVKTPNILVGIVNIPATHNGVKVVSIGAGAFADQPRITGFALTSNVIHLAERVTSGLETSLGAFDIEDRILDIYMGLTESQALNCGLLSYEYDGDGNIIDRSENKWFIGGYLYYRDDWEYGDKYNSIPYLKVSKLNLEFDNLNINYDGYAKKPVVTNVTTDAILVNKEALSLNNEISADLFNYTYSNNVTAGTAYVNVSINTTELNAYNKTQSNANKLYFLGSGKYPFTINKKLIQLYPSGGNFTTVYGETWKNSVWNDSNISGLDGTSFVFSGTLTTKSENAGTYMSAIGQNAVNGSFGSFTWINDWSVKLHGVDVTNNFRLQLAPFGMPDFFDPTEYLDTLTVVIEKRDVLVEWIGGKWSPDNSFYLWPYTGKVIEPQATAKTTDTGYIINDIMTASVTEFNKVILPTYVKNASGDYEFTNSSYTATTFKATASLTSSAARNYNLVIDNAGTYESVSSVDVHYHVTNGTITIKINYNDFVIDPDANYWSFSDWYNGNIKYASISGLGEGMIFKGELITTDENGGNMKGEHSTELGTITWKPSDVVTSTETFGTEQNYFIYILNDDGEVETYHMDYYDVIVDATVVINYNQFDVQYDIDGTAQTLTPSLDGAGNLIYEIYYPTEGATHTLVANVLNTNSLGDIITGSEILYRYGTNTTTPNPFVFNKIGEYRIGVGISRRNFDYYYINIDLNVVKSDIEFDSLTKEYDGLPVDPSTKILKISNSAYDVLAEEQKESLKFTYYLASDTTYSNPLTEIPYKIGKYVVHATAIESEYFNALDSYIPFEITKRKLYIDVEQLGSFKFYDGQQHAIEFNGAAIDRLLSGDLLTGVLKTAGKDPGVYAGNDSTKWYWSPSWAVFNNETNEDNSEYYQIVLQGSYEIKKLIFKYDSATESVVFDGYPHKITVEVTVPSTGYKIYYYHDSEHPTSIVNETNDEKIAWREAPYNFFTPGTYTVSFKIVADYYETAYGYETIEIFEKDISYAMPELIVDYIGEYQQFKITVNDPASAVVLYSTDGVNYSPKYPEFINIGSYKIYYRISEEYYKTIDSVCEFIITDENLRDVYDTYIKIQNVDTNYTGDPHSIKVDILDSIMNSNGYKVYYRLSEDAEWSLSNPAIADSGYHIVYVRVIAKGHKIYQTTGYINIKKLNFNVELISYNSQFDNQYHTVHVNFLDDYSHVDYKIYYSIDPNSQATNEGWRTDPIMFKNASSVANVVYVKIEADNYETKYLEGTVMITVLTNPDALIPDDLEIQYLGRPIPDVEVITLSDGMKNYTYYNTYLDEYDNLQVDYSVIIGNPTEIGTYYVEVQIVATENCGPAECSGFFKIVPRVLTPQFTEEFEYDGLAHEPYVTVVTGTEDVVVVQKAKIGFTGNPIEIGEYKYSLSLVGDNGNYVLEYDEITFKIVPRKLNIVLRDEKEYDGEFPWNKNSNWNEFGGEKVLSNHVLILEMETSSYVRDTYIYTKEEGISNIVRIIKFDITNLSGDSVLHLYNVKFDVVVNIVYQKLDYEFDDTYIPYDGKPHNLSLVVDSPEIENPELYYAEKYDPENPNATFWLTEKLSFIDVGIYTVWVKIESTNCEDIITNAKLYITQATPEIVINTFDETYYDKYYKIDYSVTNIAGIGLATSVKYYPSSVYKTKDIMDLYKEKDFTNKIYRNALTQIKDAGEYIAVVMYEEAHNWKYAYAMKNIVIKHKDIHISLKESNIFNEKNYDGYKYDTIFLGGSTIIEDDLVDGHILGNRKSQYRIQTNSANAGTYVGKDGFEFKYMEIYDQDGNNVFKNYRPVITSGIEIIIHKIEIDLNKFKVYDNEREYAADYDEYLDAYVPRLADPIIDYPELYYFDNQPHYTYYTVKNNSFGDLLGIDNQSDVGYYFVVVKFDEGTNFKEYKGADLYALVRITPKTVDVDWIDLSQAFTAEGLAPGATYKDVYMFDEELDVFFIDENGDKVDTVINAGSYQVFAEFKHETKNYVLNTDTTDNTFIVTPISYSIMFDEVTYNTDSEWTKDVFTTDFTDFIEGLSMTDSSGTRNANITTSSNKAGIYQGSDLIWDYKIVTEDGLDVTQSINLIAEGRVLIISEGIDFTSNNVIVTYDGQTHSIWEGLNIKKPAEYTVQYRTDPEGMWDSVEYNYEFIDVGTYDVYFKIDATNMDSKYGMITIVINKADPTFAIKNNIDKVYDAEAINRNVLQYTGSFNGTYDDLRFTYYECDENFSRITDIKMNNDPVDVGYYQLVITSRLDEEGIGGNYTELMVVKNFRITPRTITLTIDEEVEVDNTSLANIWYKQIEKKASLDLNLADFDYLTYRVETVSAQKLGRYELSKLFEYRGAANKVEYFGEGNYFKFTWSVGKYDSSNTFVYDTTMNYNLQFDFDLFIRYALIEHTIEDVYASYNPSKSHFATLVTEVAGLTQTYSYDNPATSGIDKQTDNISAMSFTDPGTYVISYTLAKDQYETVYGTYKIVIQHAERVLDTTISLDQIKVYDGVEVKIPAYGFVAGSYVDNYDKSLIKVEYQRVGFNYVTTSITDVGVYDYKLVIPQSTYYSETVIEGTYTITKATIKVEGTYTAPYDGQSVAYNNFGTDSAFTITANGNPLPAGTVLKGTLVTQYGNKGEYTSTANTLFWKNGFKLINSDGDDLAHNYVVDLVGKIIIEDGVMIITYDEYQTFEYDGTYHIPNITMGRPLRYNKISYSIIGPDSGFTTEIGKDSGYKNVCTEQPVWVKIEANNYATEIIMIYITVEKAETYLVIPDLSKIYDYQEVLLPESFQTNTDVPREKWLLRYEINDSVNGWMDMGDERPINVGKYRLIVEIKETESANYHGGEFVGAPFKITGLPIEVRWIGENFIYNGKTQHPIVHINSGDTMPIDYEIIPNTELTPNADANSINAGIYTVKLIIDTSNSNFIIPESDYSKSYSIVKRNITLSLHKTRNHSSSFFEFEYGDGTNPDTIPFEYVVNNLVENHYFSDNSILVNKYQSVGVYTQISDFEWKYGQFDILDSSNSDCDVSMNYNLKYDLELTIDYSTYEYDIKNVDVEYDGKEHRIEVIMDNSAGYEITYSLTKDGTYTKENPAFVNVYLDDSQKVAKRIVWFKIVDPLGNKKDEINCGEVLIRQKNANLRLEDQYQRLDKTYDGKNVENPAVVYTDMDTMPRTITYTYYPVYGDGSLGDPTKMVYSAGNYKLLIIIDDGNNHNYSSAELPIFFKIEKRVLTVSIIGSNSLPMPISKVYDALTLNYVITNASVQNLAEPEIETFTGTIQTRSAMVGNYTKNSDFIWMNEYTIFKKIVENGIETSLDVKKNYDIKFDLDFTISPAEIEYEAYDVIGDWNGNEYEFKVQVNVPNNATVYYWTDTDPETTDPIKKTDRGTYTVYFRIEANNYKTVDNVSKRIIINGLPGPNPNPSPNPPVNPYIIYEQKVIYNGKEYMSEHEKGKPVYSNPDHLISGKQTVVYYDAADYATNGDAATPLASTPINAGSYVFIIQIEADAIYEAYTTNPQSFTIERKIVKVDWEGLETTYNGKQQVPTASYTNVFGVKVELDVSTSQILAGEDYPVVATPKSTDTDTPINYILEDSTNCFTIKQKEIAEPTILEGMSFVYSESFELLDSENLPYILTIGEPIMIKNADGNIYVVESDGTVSAITDIYGNIINNDPQFDFKIKISSDFNVDGVNTTIEKHLFTVELNDKSNYIWANKKHSNNLEVQYNITQYEIPNPEDYEVKTKIVGQTKKPYYIYNDEPIEPEIELKLYTIDNIFIKTLTDVTTSSRYAEYEIYDYVDNDKISDPDEDKYAKVLVRGINNFNFEIEIEFEITDSPPSLLELEAGHTIEFISVTTSPETGIITVVEDGSVAKKDANQANLYIGRLHQNFTIQNIIDQFKNDPTLLKVYDSNGNLIDQTNYTNPFGTGYTIKLFEKLSDTEPVDTITGILYGDVNGDGFIDAFDGSTMEELLGGTGGVTPDSLGVKYYAGLITRTSSTPDAFEASVLQTYLGNKSNDNDFNYNFLTKAA